MGSQFSYPNNEERKLNGLRYDNPVTKEYLKAPNIKGFYKPKKSYGDRRRFDAYHI